MIDYRTKDGGSFVGDQYPDGTIGYDYGRQVWVDTRTSTLRDKTMPAGSASNPLPTLPLKA